jgi:DNA-binding NtrC family response regulator
MHFDEGSWQMNEKNQLQGKKILIVDDEPDILETLEELLSECEIEKASSFKEAKNKLEKQNFDMAILDIMGVDGYRLLDIANSKKVTSVMLTAHAMTVEDTLKSYKKGAAYFVPKAEMHNIAVFLSDILEAKEKGKSSWWRWLDRLGSYYDKEFGPDWKEGNRDFWEKMNYLP